MKYIKPFKLTEAYNIPLSKLSEDDTDDIMDVFRDMLVEEYDMEDLNLGNNHADLNLGTSYTFSPQFLSNVKYRAKGIEPKYDCIEIKIYSPLKNGHVIKFKNQKRIFQSIDDFIKRVELMGYKTKKEIKYLVVAICGGINFTRSYQSQLIDFIKIIITK